MELHLKLWLENGGEVVYGDGRHMLLSALERHGSLAGAARELGMSYRAAWGRLRASEERLGFKLTEPGSKGHRGMHLTEKARRFMEEFEKMRDLADEMCRRAEEEWPKDLE